MRRTGSRESRERRDASATSPTSIAVNTCSMRFGSRRYQRPAHQNARSITTVSPTSETSRIGHMIGPPLRKLSIRKFSLPFSAAGEALGDALIEAAGDALSVAATVDPGAGDIPGAVAGDIPGAVTGAIAGDIPTAGGGICAAGLAGTAGFAGATVAAGAPGGGTGGVWPNAINVSVT